MLADFEIEHRAKRGMISPYMRDQMSDGVISYGLSSYGYDIRISNQFKKFTNLSNAVVDPKNFDPKNFVDERIEEGNPLVIPPNSFVLGKSVEFIRMPRDLLAICLGKSTYARCGIILNVTPLEPEWEGFITMEISNSSPNPALIYPNEGIAQLIFLRASNLCQVSYKDRKGKYQNQSDIELPKV